MEGVEVFLTKMLVGMQEIVYEAVGWMQLAQVTQHKRN